MDAGLDAPLVIAVDAEDGEDCGLVPELPFNPRLPDEVINPQDLVLILVVRSVNTDDMILEIVVIILFSWTDLEKRTFNRQRFKGQR